MTSAIADEFESHRPRLFGLAYRMLGSAEEAEDTGAAPDRPVHTDEHIRRRARGPPAAHCLPSGL